MMVRMIAVLTVTYLLVGAVLMAVTYLLTGVDQGYIHAYEPAVLNATAQLRWVPDVAIGFVVCRLHIGILVAVILALCSKRRISGWPLLLAGVGVPFFYEIAPLPGQSLDGTWLHMLWVVVRTWPDVPDWVLPAGRLLRTATSSLAPAALTGLILSLWVNARNRRPQSGGVSESPEGTALKTQH